MRQLIGHDGALGLIQQLPVNHRLALREWFPFHNTTLTRPGLGCPIEPYYDGRIQSGRTARALLTWLHLGSFSITDDGALDRMSANRTVNKCMHLMLN